MMFYRLAFHKILKLLHLEDIFTEDDQRNKAKQVYKTVLNIDQKMDMYVSILLSVINILIFLTIPAAALKKPSQIFKDRNMHVLYCIASWIERNTGMIDRLTIAMCIVLTCVTTKMIMDGISATNISMSPWRERGKYILPIGFRSY